MVPFAGHIIVALVELSWLFSMIALGSDSWSAYSSNGFTVSFGLWSGCSPTRGGGTVCQTFNACDDSAQAQAVNQCGNVGGARTFTVLCFLALLFAAFSVPLYVYQAKLPMVYAAIPASMGKLKDQLQRKMMHVILCLAAFAFALIGWACWTGVQNGVNNSIGAGGIALGYSAGFGLMVTLWIFIAIAAALLWISPIPGAPDTPAGGAKPATGQPTTAKPVTAQPAAQPASGQATTA